MENKRRQKKRPQKAAAAAETVLILLALAAMAVALNWAGTRYLRAAYPDKYRETVMAAAETCDLPPSLIFAVIRTESHFRPEAVSSAGAMGLMQVTADTFEWVQMRTGGAEGRTAADLTDPDVNIAVGASALMLLREMFPEEDTALAAYNAGLGTVKNWLADEACSSDGVHLDAIPYAETEHYVDKVRKAQRWYQKIYDIP